MKKIFKVLVILMIQFICIDVNAKINMVDNSMTDSEMEKNYQMLMITSDIQNLINDYYKINDSYNDNYPEYYGGIYIEENSNYVVIQIVKENIPSKNSKDYELYKKILSISDKVKIEYVANSFNELNHANNLCSSKMIINQKNIVGCYIDVADNSSVFQLSNNSMQSQNAVLEKINNDIKNKDIIRFENRKIYTPSTNIKAGGKILLVIGGDPYCSMGLRTKYNGNNGYVTAGHCALHSISFPSGNVILRQFSNNQSYDYAFVRTNSSYTPLNDLESHPSNMSKIAVVRYSYALSVGLKIGKSGVRTGYTTGKITGLNKTVNYDMDGDGYGDTIIHGLVESNVYQGQGDSGGIVLVPRSDENGGGIPIGILSGGINMSNKMLFTQISTLPSQLALNTY